MRIGIAPALTGVQVDLRVSVPVGNGSRDGVAYRRRFGKNLFHPLIYRERSFFIEIDMTVDADTFHLFEHVRTPRIIRLAVDELTQILVEPVVARMDRIEDEARRINELHVGWMLFP